MFDAASGTATSKCSVSDLERRRDIPQISGLGGLTGYLSRRKWLCKHDRHYVDYRIQAASVEVSKVAERTFCWTVDVAQLEPQIREPVHHIANGVEERCRANVDSHDPSD